MATLARKLTKVAIFIAMFLISARYIRIVPYPLNHEQTGVLLDISDALGVADAELLYLGFLWSVHLAFVSAIFWLGSAIWRKRLKR